MSSTQTFSPAAAAELWTPHLARLRGGFEVARRLATGYRAPVAPTPYDVVAREGATRLLHFESQTVDRPPLLISPSLINRYYILDLTAGNSLIEALVAAGHDVYCIDWGTPGAAERELGLDGYVTKRLDRLVDATLADAGQRRLHLLGHCLGGTLATIFAAGDGRQRLVSLINLTAPIGFHDDGMLSTWSRAPLFDARTFAEVIGDVPAWITQPSFNLLRPLSQPVKAARLWQRLGDEGFLDFFWCMETWVNDNVSIPKQFYVDLIYRLYREDGLMSGSLRVDGAPVALERIAVPVLTVCAAQDHIVPLASARCGAPRFAHPDSRLEELAGGHIGVVVGGRSRRVICPLIDRWLVERSEELAP